jgi:hypothetical protein
MRHSFVAGLDEVTDGLLQIAVLGESSRLPEPKATQIEFRSFLDGQVCAGLVVTRIVAVII